MKEYYTVSWLTPDNAAIRKTRVKAASKEEACQRVRFLHGSKVCCQAVRRASH